MTTYYKTIPIVTTIIFPVTPKKAEEKNKEK